TSNDLSGKITRLQQGTRIARTMNDLRVGGVSPKLTLLVPFLVNPDVQIRPRKPAGRLNGKGSLVAPGGSVGVVHVDNFFLVVISVHVPGQIQLLLVAQTTRKR